MAKKTKPRRGGFAIALALLIIVILSATGLGLLSLGQQSRITAIRNASDIAAKRAADAGLTKALVQLNSMLKTKTWDSSNLPTATYEMLPNSGAIYSYNVTKDNEMDSYVIESVGMHGRGTRKTNATLRLESPFEYAIFTQGTMELKNGTTVDAYNLSDDDAVLQVGTNSTADASVIMKSGVTIDGDVVVGAEGDPDLIINSTTEATITGQTYPLIEEHEFPPITLPPELIESPPLDTITTSTTITDSAAYTGINLGMGNIINIDTPITLVVFGDVIFDNSAQLQIADESINPDASLILYVGGDLITKNGGTINNTSQDPRKLKIYGFGDAQRFDFKNTSAFYGAIYAPNADLHLHNSAEIYGSVVVNSFVQDVSANLHYDASLREVKITDEAVRFIIERWQEE